MIPGFVDGLKIENVKNDIEKDVIPSIEFTINGIEYRLLLKKNENGKYYPGDVFHSRDICEFCSYESAFCDELGRYIDELFQRLIKFNSIRMQWLYLPHEHNE